MEKSCLWVAESNFNVNFGTVCIEPCAHDGVQFCLITFILHMQVVNDESKKSIDFGLQGQMSRSTLALYLQGLWA